MADFITQNWTFLQQNLWPGRLMFVIFLASLIILAFDKRGSARRVFWYSLILLAGVVYNPYFWFSIVNRIYKDDDLVQLRLAWMVPALLIIAYAFSRIVFLAKKWQVSALIAAAFMALIWWSGSPFHPDLIVEKQNIYKISEEAKEVSDAILADMRDHPENLPARPELSEFNTTDYASDIAPAGLYHYGIRQYTSAFSAFPHLVPEEIYTAEGFDVAQHYSEPSQYLTYEISAEVVGEQAERYGYEEVSRTKEHVIMRYHRDASVYLVIRGQTLADTSGELRGISGTASLTTTGWWRILELGRELSDVRFSAAYASEVGQAQATATVILRLNRNRDSIPNINPMPVLNDITWGSCEGMKRVDALVQFGPEALSLGNINDPAYVSPIGAETKYNAANRYGYGMGDTVKTLTEDGQNILVVANPSITWWLRRDVNGGRKAGKLQPGDCVKLKFTDGVWTVEEVMKAA